MPPPPPQLLVLPPAFNRTKFEFSESKKEDIADKFTLSSMGVSLSSSSAMISGSSSLYLGGWHGLSQGGVGGEGESAGKLIAGTLIVQGW